MTVPLVFLYSMVRPLRSVRATVTFVRFGWWLPRRTRAARRGSRGSRRQARHGERGRIRVGHTDHRLEIPGDARGLLGPDADLVADAQTQRVHDGLSHR